MDSFIRKKNRIENFDYASENSYFITICSKNRKCIFGKIKNKQMTCSDFGNLIISHIKIFNKTYADIKIINYVIMPNHIHMIILIKKNHQISISRAINQFKGSISKEAGCVIWQKSFYDHVIRDEKDYFRILEYMYDNVLEWYYDKYFVEETLESYGDETSPLR